MQQVKTKILQQLTITSRDISKLGDALCDCKEDENVVLEKIIAVLKESAMKFEEIKAS